MFDEWLIAGWQARPHDSLRDPYLPKRAMSPNEKYTSLVQACGYLPLTLSGEDYLELLPVSWRQINDYGIRIDYRTYDCADLGPWRRQHSGNTLKRGLWEVHYDPYDLSRVFVRTRRGWITVPWVHLPLVNSPFADFTWRHARRLAAETGLDDTHEASVGRVLDDLLTRAGTGPADKQTARVIGRARASGPALPHPTESRSAPAVEPDSASDPPPDNPLTTKEGWRRFVDHEPAPPHLLTSAGLAKLSSRERDRYDQLRRDYHSDLPLVNTPVIRKVIGTSRLLLQLNKKQISARRGVIISGASGTGKTTALSQLGRAHELATRKRYPSLGNRLPVIYVTVPPAATPRMFAVEFARFFGLDFPGRANLTDIVNAVCATAAHVHVDLVLVDELHNLNLATRAGAESSDQLKYFAERLRATFVYAGINLHDQGLFAGVRGSQIAGRFTVIPATSFSFSPGEDRTAWTGLVETLESMLRLHNHRPGTLAALAEQLYHRSGGMIGSLSQLIRGAAVLAIEDGSEQITEDLLALVPVDYAAEQAERALAPTKSGTRTRPKKAA